MRASAGPGKACIQTRKPERERRHQVKRAPQDPERHVSRWGSGCETPCRLPILRPLHDHVDPQDQREGQTAGDRQSHSQQLHYGGHQRPVGGHQGGPLDCQERLHQREKQQPAQRRTGHAPGEPQRSHTGSCRRTSAERQASHSGGPNRAQIAHRSGMRNSSTSRSSARRRYAFEEEVRRNVHAVPRGCYVRAGKSRSASSSCSLEPMSYQTPGKRQV